MSTHVMPMLSRVPLTPAMYNAMTRFFLPAGNNNEAQDFLAKGGQVIVRMRGLPYECTAKEVIDFFEGGENGCSVLHGEEGVLFVKRPDGRPTGDAFVQFENEDDGEKALSKHRESIGTRYIELFRSTTAEVQQVLNRSMDPKTYEQQTPLIAQVPQIPILPQQFITSGTRKDCIRLRGLPYEARVEHILEFLEEYSKNIIYQGVHMVYNAQGQPSGEAFIEMDSEQSASMTAKNKHHRYMVFGKKQRYIEVFQCSGEDMHVVLTGGISGPQKALMSPGMLPSPTSWDHLLQTAAGTPTAAPTVALPPPPPVVQTQPPPPIHPPPPMHSIVSSLRPPQESLWLMSLQQQQQQQAAQQQQQAAQQQQTTQHQPQHLHIQQQTQTSLTHSSSGAAPPKTYPPPAHWEVNGTVPSNSNQVTHVPVSAAAAAVAMKAFQQPGALTPHSAYAQLFASGASPIFSSAMRPQGVFLVNMPPRLSVASVPHMAPSPIMSQAFTKSHHQAFTSSAHAGIFPMVPFATAAMQMGLKRSWEQAFPGSTDPALQGVKRPWQAAYPAAMAHPAAAAMAYPAAHLYPAM